MSDANVFTRDGTRIRYLVVGDGPPLVVQPPDWGIGAAIYEVTSTSLAEHAAVITYDTRGSGDSERAVDPTSLNVGQFVHDLDDLRSRLGIERFALMGHSDGGYIAVNYALTIRSGSPI